MTMSMIGYKKKPLWLVQKNLYGEYAYVQFLQSLDRLGAEYMVVQPIPFTNILLKEDFDSTTDDTEDINNHITFETDRPVIAMGATSLIRIANARGWESISFLNENFHYSKWKENWGANILNYESHIGTASTVKNWDNWENIFVRPTEDTKAISGTVMGQEDFMRWQLQVSEIEDIDEFNPMHKNTEVVISPAINIQAEYRMFIIDGKVITGSLYKLGNRVVYDDKVDRDIIFFTGRVAKEWHPSDAYVLDIARTENGLKIIEMNNINSAGFYAADTLKIIHALENLVRYGSFHREGILI